MSNSQSITHTIPQVNINKNLHKKFTQLSKQRHHITYQLLALLPKIYEQKIYKEEGYQTIYEYAGRLAGLSRSVVEKTLKLGKHLEGKPCLQKAIETQGVHKVAIVAKLATPETDAAWTDKVKHMSKSTLQELSKEVRKNNKVGVTLNGIASQQDLKIHLDEEMQFLFSKAKNKLSKKHGSLSNKETLRMILKQLNEDENKVQLVKKKRRKKVRISKKNTPKIKEDGTARPELSEEVKKIPGDFCKNEKKHNRKEKKASRYIPVQLKRKVLKKTNGRCAFPNCNKAAEHFHHTDRFSENRNSKLKHDSVHDSIVPLCKTHHEFAHNGIIEDEKEDPKSWQIHISTKPLREADVLFRKYKQASSH